MKFFRVVLINFNIHNNRYTITNCLVSGCSLIDFFLFDVLFYLYDDSDICCVGYIGRNNICFN